jgi:dedicator of cytokinesis protein 6/7/8
VDRVSLHPDKVYLQLASVVPYFDPSEVEFRTTMWDRNFNTCTQICRSCFLSAVDRSIRLVGCGGVRVAQFIFEAAYASGPKQQTEDLSKQQKKKTIFTTELAFPYVKTRLEITSKRDVILSPIENAIELVEVRARALRVSVLSER